MSDDTVTYQRVTHLQAEQWVRSMTNEELLRCVRSHEHVNRTYALATAAGIECARRLALAVALLAEMNTKVGPI